jgi:HD-GYP domain-containing protein (c-di-GMP phosphodiesterase class II)
VEDGLNAQEVAEIFFVAFRDRMEQFLDQPQKENLTSLVNDIAILAEYLWADPCRVAFLTKTLQKEYSLAVHSVNTMFIGLAIHVMASGGSLERESVVSLALGLLVHDLGMANVPIFIRDKKQYLVRRDRESIEKHLAAGLGKIKRLQIHESVVTDCMAQHHERLDGSGYPERRKGDALSMAGRLCGVADSFSAIIGDRPYHDARVVQTAAQTLAEDMSRYDERLTALLLQLVGSESPICGETGESV